jgi:hypothetical protein
MNEPEVAEVVRHLVDEERRPLAVGARLFEENLAEPPAILRAQLRQYGGIARVRSDPDRGRAERDDLLNVGQLLRALHARVRSEDLLEQRRAGTRQADDENRIGIGAPQPRALRKKF